MTFKVGDKVRVVSSFFNSSIIGKTAVVAQSAPSHLTLRFDYVDHNNLHSGLGLGNDDRFWFVMGGSDAVLEAVANKPTLATTVRLYPQDRTVLAHLEAGKPITPMKALVVYGLSRLAAQIRNLRRAGFNVSTTIMVDEAGHKYASYQLHA